MLSRVANSLYWLSRYVERAENLARLVAVNRHDELDESGGASDDRWSPLLYATGGEPEYSKHSAGKSDSKVDWFFTFSPENPDSIRQCVAQARENARMVRDQISEEMWLELNSFYLFIQSAKAEQQYEQHPDRFYRQAINFCMQFSGLINATLLHDEGWYFIQAGKFLERADKTTRILDMLTYEGSLDRAKLASALRACSAFSAFQKEYRWAINLPNVIAFLLFSEDFPRSVRFCLRELDVHLHCISGTAHGTFSNEVERLTGSVLAHVNFTNVEEVLGMGSHAYIDGLQQQFNEIGQQVFETYVLLPREVNNIARTESWHWQQQQQQQ